MIERKIHKDVRKYKEKIVGGLTLRQLIAVVITAIVVIPLYQILKMYLGENITSYVIMIVALPILLTGFYDKDGLNFEKYIKYFIEFHFITPQKRKYVVENIMEED